MSLNLPLELSRIIAEKDWSIDRCTDLICRTTGFNSVQLFILTHSNDTAVPLLSNESLEHPVVLTDRDNPIVQTIIWQKQAVINSDSSNDSFLPAESHIVLTPLLCQGTSVGVLALWSKNAASVIEPSALDEITVAAGMLALLIREESVAGPLRQAQAHIQLLKNISDQIRKDTDISTKLKSALKVLCDQFSLACATAVTFDWKSEVSSRIISGLQSNSDDELAKVLRITDKLTYKYLTKLLDGRTICLRVGKDTVQAEEIDQPARAVIKFVVLVPLHDGKALRGTVCLMSSSSTKPLSQDLELFTLLGRFLAQLLAEDDLTQQFNQAVKDRLTALFNNAYFMSQLNKHHMQYQHRSTPFSIIYIDIDQLKTINDYHGLTKGDDAIQFVAQTLHKIVNPNYVLARMRGEEFAILIPDCISIDARQLAEYIRASIAEEPNNQYKVTISAGVCSLPANIDDPFECMTLVREIAHLAKHRGGNQVCDFQDHKMNLEKERAAIEEGEKRTPQDQQKRTQPGFDRSLVAEHGLLGVLGNVVRFVEETDGSTEERSPLAVKYAGIMAQVLNLSSEVTSIISLSMVLHQLGKVVVNRTTLVKQAPLNDEEWKELKSVPSAAARILAQGRVLHAAASVVEGIRENWDGTGYPKGLKQGDIPLEARIGSIIDAYVAMISPRAYRKAMSKSAAIQQLQDGSGTRWDPRLVRLFIKILQKEDEFLDAAHRT